MFTFNHAWHIFTVRAFEDEKHLVAYYLKENADIIACGIVFEKTLSANQIGSNFSVKLRFPFIPKRREDGFSAQRIDQFTWQTARLFPMFQEPGPRAPENVDGGPPSYLNEGFLYVQHHLSKSIALYLNPNLKKRLESVQVNIQRFPYPAYEKDLFIFALIFFFPL